MFRELLSRVQAGWDAHEPRAEFGGYPLRLALDSKGGGSGSSWRERGPMPLIVTLTHHNAVYPQF